MRQAVDIGSQQVRLGLAEELGMRRHAPGAALVDTALGQVSAERAATYELLQAAAPAGVSVHLVESTTTGTTDLTFSTTAEGVDPSNEGFDNVAGDLTFAGAWATINGPTA